MLRERITRAEEAGESISKEDRKKLDTDLIKYKVWSACAGCWLPATALSLLSELIWNCLCVHVPEQKEWKARRTRVMDVVYMMAEGMEKKPAQVVVSIYRVCIAVLTLCLERAWLRNG